MDLKIRPIRLLFVAYKIFTEVNAKSIRTTVDLSGPNDQAGFHNGYSMIEHVDTINQVIEKCDEYNQPYIKHL